MKLKLNKANMAFYSVISLMVITVVLLLQSQNMRAFQLDSVSEKRVIKCEVPLPNKLVQNLYFMATDLQTAKQMLFNSQKGLFFDNKLYIKTADFKGQSHVVAFDQIFCDSVGQQVSFSSL